MTRSKRSNKRGRPGPVDTRLKRLREVIDTYSDRYRELRGASTFEEYLAAPKGVADEGPLTDPLLANVIEQVLGFPPGAYFPQLRQGTTKPDFTPIDLVAHPFVLDAKGTDENLASHEAQIRRYVDQRGLGSGVLFNLREIRVFRGGASGYDRELSFPVLPLWKVARGEALPGPEVDRFLAFCERFRHREMGLGEKIAFVRAQPPWSTRLRGDGEVVVDVEFLVEKLRLLAGELADDAGSQVEALEGRLRLNPGRRRKLLEELELIALDLAPRLDLDRLPNTLDGWRAGEGIPGRAWRQYLVRVAYLSLVRVLLYRAWEDVQLVEDLLYDGGFDRAYARMSENVGQVLEEAFHHGRDRYHWLYGPDNNYDWYRPRDPVLVDILYSLAPVPLGRLDADVLGTLYEAYAEQIDRDRLGQFFTPRPVIRFMLDRAGFSGPDGVFRIEGDERRPVRVLDFATGSGGFLVEAARRVIDEGGIGIDDRSDVLDALAAIVNGFVGGEISAFPYYLTEVNLLLQVSRLLGHLTLAGGEAPPFVLGALHIDTLAAKSAPARAIERLDPHAALVQDERFDLVPLDAEKQERYRELREDGGFDLVVGNPPYVTEAGNKILFDRLRSIPAWQGIYKGKTDYLYYFLLLAIEKLAPGGRLCVITPAGWMNAGAADILRERLASELRLDQLFLFGSYRLFAPEGEVKLPTPTVESAILVATKTTPRKGHKLRVVALEDEAAAARELSGDANAKSPDRQALLDELARRRAGRTGRKGGIHVLDVPQADLRPERPWPVKWSATDVAARVVAHLESQHATAAKVVSLESEWAAFQGIKTGADAYSNRVQRRLSPAVRSSLAAAGATTGDPIMELPSGWESRPPWVQDAHLLARSPEPEAILYGAIDDSDYTSLVWLFGDSNPRHAVLAELEPWREVLASRYDIESNPAKSWWETARPRDRTKMKAPKVIALYRTDRGRFALDEAGEWQPSIKATICVGRDADAPVAYLCGLLNSELLDLWYSVRGKVPRDVWRNYEPKRMNEIPYRRPDGDPQADRVAAFVREIAANRRALLPHRVLFPELRRVVKDPWKTGPVSLDHAALVAQLPAAETISVRLDPALALAIESTPLGKPSRQGPDVLVFQRSRKETARVSGDPVRLDVLERLLVGKAPGDLPGFLLPRDLAGFERLAAGRTAEVERLLAEGRRLVEEVERLACALYDVPDDLTEAVVDHAVRRAESPARG